MPAELHPGLAVKTHDHFVRRKFVDVSMDHQVYPVASAIKRNAMRSMGRASDGTRYVMNFGLPVEVTTSGGTQIKWNIKVTKGGNFQWVTGSTPVNVDRRDYEVQGSAPWRMCRVHYSLNDEELNDARGPEEITDLRLTRSLGSEQDFVAGFETWAWSPPPPSTDLLTAYPIRYALYTEPESTAAAYTNFTSLVRSGAGNFLNVNHNSYTAGPYGQSRATYNNLGNWNCQYTTFADTDFVEKFTAACLKIGFMSPVMYPQLDPKTLRHQAFTTTANCIVKARLARQQNDANTSDLQARYNDADLFQTPMFAHPYFDDADFSVYGGSNKDVCYLFDWNSWSWVTKSGFDLIDRTYNPQLEAPLDTTYVKFLRGNLICWNPRRNAVLSK